MGVGAIGVNYFITSAQISAAEARANSATITQLAPLSTSIELLGADLRDSSEEFVAMRSEVVSLVDGALTWRQSDILEALTSLGSASNDVVVKFANVGIDTPFFNSIVALSQSEGLDVSMVNFGSKAIASFTIVLLTMAS